MLLQGKQKLYNVTAKFTDVTGGRGVVLGTASRLVGFKSECTKTRDSLRLQRQLFTPPPAKSHDFLGLRCAISI